MKKILINFVALHGGGCIYSLEIAKALCDNQYDVYAIVSDKMDNIEDWKNDGRIKLFCVNGYSNKVNFVINSIFFLMFGHRRLSSFLKNISFDLIYIPFVTYWTAIIQKYISAKRVVYTAHDVIPHNNKKSIIYRIQNKMAKISDDIIVLSQSSVLNASKTFDKPTSNIYVLPHGNCFKFDADKHESEMYPSDTFNFIFYGQISPYKGLDVLAKAFKKVFNIRKDISLTIAGSGDFQNYIELFNSIGCQNIRIINKWISDSDVPELFSAKKQIAVLPYKSATQSGVIPLAMHLKTVVLATKCDGLIEQLQNGRIGFLAEVDNPDDLANKMLHIINNWNEAKTVADSAYSYIESLEWKNIVNIYLNSIFY